MENSALFKAIKEFHETHQDWYIHSLNTKSLLGDHRVKVRNGVGLRASYTSSASLAMAVRGVSDIITTWKASGASA